MALLFSQNKVVLPAISTLFLDHRKCFDMTFSYISNPFPKCGDWHDIFSFREPVLTTKYGVSPGFFAMFVLEILHER